MAYDGSVLPVKPEGEGQPGPDASVATLTTRDLAVGYRTRGVRRAVLERVNLAVYPGDLICLLGPNGIGKSTLLRTLARMQPPLWGSIELDRAPLESLSATELARRLAVVLTERVAVEGLTAQSIVELGRYPHSGWLGRLTEYDAGIVNWAIDAVGARLVAGRDFSRLSDGERQRVMVARALAQQPAVLVLDEPTAYLDVLSRVELMGVLRDLTRDQGLAVIVSTHDLDVALRSADVVWLVMPGGEMTTGAPEDVVLSGGIAQAFEGRQIRFNPEQRSFRWLSGARGEVLVNGEGLRATMAAATVEREGFQVARPGASRPVWQLFVDESGWRVGSDGSDHRGDTFASLAAFLRGRRERV